MTRFLWPLLGHSRVREVRLARAEIDRERLAPALRDAERSRALLDRMRLVARDPHVTVGRTAEGVPFRVRLADLDGAHFWATGATGAGKSFAIAAVLDQVIEAILRGERIAIVVIVMQGFLADMLLGAIGRRLLTVSDAARAAFLGRLHVLRFHRGGALVPWNLLAREDGVSVLEQGAAYAEVIEQVLGARFGSRQELAMSMLLAVAIEQGLSLPELRAELNRIDLIAARGARSAIPEVRLYFTERFRRESAASLDGIRSRLDLLLRSEVTKAVLHGPERLPVERMLAPGSVTLMDFSGGPLTVEGSRALAGLAFQLLGFQTFNPRRPRDGFTLMVGDELQQALSPATIRVVDTLLTTARAHRVGLGIVHQALAQLPRELEEILSANARYRFVFRTSREESRRVGEFLPEPEDATAARAQERLVGRLPAGRMFFTDRLFDGGPMLLDAPRFEAPSLTALPTALREALERGALGVPRDELFRRAALAERATLSRIEGTPREALASTPDLVTRRRRP